MIVRRLINNLYIINSISSHSHHNNLSLLFYLHRSPPILLLNQMDYPINVLYTSSLPIRYIVLYVLIHVVLCPPQLPVIHSQMVISLSLNLATLMAPSLNTLLLYILYSDILNCLLLISISIFPPYNSLLNTKILT
ncbi:MAG: hypothetical protein KatS3mg129_2338 [Leptospiraceae bacterium]|nr:MAG: hypothetical protein KatS3mg129_2338 [Leptospiraceae bacterium]